jgi:hypothetical protein
MILIRDASNFDGSVSYIGLGGFTHKVTEGISVVHDQYGPRLNAARDAGVPVLGSYHVLRSPNATNGSYAAQLAFWVQQMDLRTPWWRSWPHFVLQIDAERWSYDNVTPTEVLTFAALLAGSGLPGFKVTYASRGQYGDALTGIRTPLWNADYRASSGGAYPGDGWTATSSGAPAGWAPYSGQIPVFLQYTSTPYDENAYRGTLAELLALVGTNGATTMSDTVITWNTGWMLQRYFEDADPIVVPPNDSIGAKGFSIPNLPKQARVAAAADAKAAAALPTTVSMTDADRTAIVADLATDLGGAVARLEGKLDELLAVLRAGAQAEATALNPSTGA